MSFQRLAAAAAALSIALTANANAFADVPSPQTSVACVADTLEALFAPSLVDGLGSPEFAAESKSTEATQDVEASARVVADDPRQSLADFAMQLRDIRYRRGGRAPTTGFDCSGFVHYVFAHALGVDLPDDSAGQFRTGTQVARGELKTGDLVFFRIHGKRISHVGIYLGEGRFIHSPTTGERVRVSRLDEQYWTRRFAGAKRVDTLT